MRTATAQGRWVLLTAVLGSGMAMLDSTVVNVALPRIGADLDADLAVLQWTVNAYMLTLAGLILLGGTLGDRYGRRRVFVTGVVWFAAASLLCGLAPDAGILIAARALQGIGGALLTPGSLALLQVVFHPDERGRAVGAWSGLGGVAAAVGPFVGGWLVDGPGWRWVFFLNVPLAAVCVPVALRHVPETRVPGAHGRFDVLGAVLGAVALGAVTYALIAAPGRGASPGVLIPAVVGVLVAVAFLAVERRRPDPMLPLRIFAVRQFSAVNAVTVCVYAAFGGFFFLAVLQLQVVAGYSALAAGTALLPTTLLMLLLSARSGELARHIGPRLPLTLGPLLCAAGMLLMMRVGTGASYVADVLPALLVLGAGMVTLVAPLTSTVLASVDVARAGLASGINNAAARAAGLVAVAALPLLAGMGPEAYRSATEFAATFRRAMPLCAGVLVVGAAIAWLTVRPPPLGAGTAGVAGEAEAGTAAAGGRGAAGDSGERPRCRPECRYHCGVAAPPLDPGAQPRMRPAPDGKPGPASDAGAGSGSGADAGSGSGLGVDAGAGPESGAEPRPESGSESGSESRPELGSESGPRRDV